MESLCDFADQLHSHRRDAVGVLARRRVKVGKAGGRAGGREGAAADPGARGGTLSACWCSAVASAAVSLEEMPRDGAMT